MMGGMATSTNQQQADKVRDGKGFIAALDQSGGSTPKALLLYGVGDDAYSNDDEMFTRMHEMRSRIMTSPSFNGDRVLGAILFEGTMDREVEGRGSADYLWSVKGVVPFLKVDKGLADEVDGAQVMKPMPDLDELLARAVGQGRVRHQDALGDQAGRPGRRGRGRRPAVRGRPPDPRRRAGPDHRARGGHPQPAEGRGRGAAQERPSSRTSTRWATGSSSCSSSRSRRPTASTPSWSRTPRCSGSWPSPGGYSREEANDRLARNHGVIASFSRALTEGLSAQQSDEEFDAALDGSIKSIYEASIT